MRMGTKQQAQRPLPGSMGMQDAMSDSILLFLSQASPSPPCPGSELSGPMGVIQAALPAPASNACAARMTISVATSEDM